MRGKNQDLYVKPRLFMPYFEETKSLWMIQDGADQLMVSSFRYCSSRGMMIMSGSVGQPRHNIPERFYVIDDALPTRSSSGGLDPPVTSSTNDLGVVTAAVPDSETLQAMIRRERKLHPSPLSHGVYSLPLRSRMDFNRQIRLRVVREFNLPDLIAEELESSFDSLLDELGVPAKLSIVLGHLYSHLNLTVNCSLSSVMTRYHRDSK